MAKTGINKNTNTKTKDYIPVDIDKDGGYACLSVNGVESIVIGDEIINKEECYNNIRTLTICTNINKEWKINSKLDRKLTIINFWIKEISEISSTDAFSDGFDDILESEQIEEGTVKKIEYAQPTNLIKCKYAVSLLLGFVKFSDYGTPYAPIELIPAMCEKLKIDIEYGIPYMQALFKNVFDKINTNTTKARTNED